MKTLIAMAITIAITMSVIDASTVHQTTKQAACLANGGTLHSGFVDHAVGQGRTFTEDGGEFTCMK